MDFLQLARKRVSVRGYKPDAVPEEHLRTVLEAARLAPSACNRQPWHVIVIRDRESRRRLLNAYPRAWFAEAPVILILCTEPAVAWSRADGKPYADVDGAIVMDHITLCAADLGLGTCWIGAFDPALLRQAVPMPPGVEPLAMTPLGWPADAGRPKARKALESLVHYDAW